MQLQFTVQRHCQKKKRKLRRRLLQKGNCHDRHKSRSRVPTRKIQSGFRNHTGTWRETKRVKCPRYGMILKSTEKSLSHMSYHRKRSFRFVKASKWCNRKLFHRENTKLLLWEIIYTTGKFSQNNGDQFYYSRENFSRANKKTLCLWLK